MTQTQTKTKGNHDDLIEKIRADGIVVIGDGKEADLAIKVLDSLRTEYKTYPAAGLSD